ncbi:MAG: amidase [SAR324 cluster bacterium]|nr:amidase [SAR324 cluster bacterium]
MTAPRNLTIFQAGARMRRGELTAEGLVLSCLERIEAREPEVKAWVYVDRERALNTAREMDKDARENRWHGPLHGIPIGIKDIFHVEGMETRGGTEAYEAHVAEYDAESVRRLREAGAIILGKAVSTPFAYLGAPETRNPWNTAHTAGGSSTGSGAAVGDRMCLAALGTQTGGSTLRPAAYNGVVGFKPTLGEISTDGVLELSWRMDHVGLIIRSTDDADLLWRVMRHGNGIDVEAHRQAMPQPVAARKPVKVWRVREFFESESSPECTQMMEEVCGLLADNGVEFIDRPLPAGFDDHQDVWYAILAAETAHNHRKRFADRERFYPEKFAELVRAGLNQKTLEYIEACRYREWLREEAAKLLGDVDAAIMPTAPAPPPDPSTTGNPMFLTPWTLCGIPALSIPAAVAPGNLPLGVQLITGAGGDEALVQIGKWCENLIGFDKIPE